MLPIYLLCALLLSVTLSTDAAPSRLSRVPRVDPSHSTPSPQPRLSPTTSHFRRSAITGELIPVPTPEILAWQAREISVLIHFNLATYLNASLYDGCNSDLGLVPSPALFTPYQLSTDQWVESMTALGANGAVLVAKHNCGFTTWPTRVNFTTLEGKHHPYNYSIAHSPVKGMDVVGSFIASCEAAHISTGFYYSVVNNNWLAVDGGLVHNGTQNSRQVNVSQKTYESIVYDQVEELWSRYGQLGEIWFDGGIRSEWRTTLAKLLAKYQPTAAIFNGCVDENGPTDDCVGPVAVRWIGTEAGDAPDPNWSTGVTYDGGAPNATVFAPGECDTTLQQNDRWFWGADQKLRNLSELVDVYHLTVGRNCLLQMDLTPDTRGLIPANYAARYAELGNVIRSCYVDQLITPYWSQCDAVSGQCLYVFDPPTSIDRIVLMEDQTQGQVIRGYTVEGQMTAQGEWQLLSRGTSVGHKKIDIFSEAVTVIAVRVTVTAMADAPVWSSIRLQLCDELTADAIRESEALDAAAGQADRVAKKVLAE